VPAVEGQLPWGDRAIFQIDAPAQPLKLGQKIAMPDRIVC
jgi:hypothetical protein